MPGSHKLGLCNHEINGYFRGKIVPENLPSNLKSVDIICPSGSLLILHCLTIHKSSENKSHKARRTFIPAYRAADAYRIYVGTHSSYHEPATKIVRSSISKSVRVEAGTLFLPFPEKIFNSLYELQENSHLKNELRKTGYYGHTVKD